MDYRVSIPGQGFQNVVEVVRCRVSQVVSGEIEDPEIVVLY